jgi:galactosamine-6-phosphate isomerase
MRKGRETLRFLMTDDIRLCRMRSVNFKQQSGLILQSYPDYERLSRAAFEVIMGQLRSRPDLLLCAATGASPTRIYELMAEQFRREPELFEKLRILKLDEWGGLAMDDPGACEFYLRQHLLEPLSIPEERYTGARSDVRFPEKECARIRDWVREHGPIDVCVLGLGSNGHLAMNEPAEALHPTAHVATLAHTTMNHAMLAQSKSRPTYGMTLGMAEILQSRKILLPVSGAAKSDQLARLMNKKITTQFPASFLWLHPDVACFCDAAAAAKLGHEG